MQTLAFGMARDRVPDRPRTLLVRARGIWMWPGIALTRDYGNVVVPIGDENLRFWITRLHGPGALDTWFARAISQATSCLTKNDETGAQRVLDGIGLNRFSADGREVMRKVAERFDIPELNLPTIAGPFLWSPRDINAFLPFFDEWSEAVTLLRKEWDEEKHLRWDKGSPESQGGRFKPRDAGDETDVQEGRSAGIGHNWNRMFPNQEPPKRSRYAWIKEIGRLLVKLANEPLEPGDTPATTLILAQLAAIKWIVDRGYDVLLETNLDPPKTLEELHDAVSQPRPGTDVHHIVEKGPARDDKFGEDLVEGRENLVRIPAMKHREITGWLMTPNETYGWLSPRRYMIGKSWDERRQIGLDALRLFGVLK